MANLRRHKRITLFGFGEFVLDLERRALYRNGEVVRLGPSPFEALAFLVLNRHRLVSRRELQAHLRPGSAYLEESGIYQVVRQVREALGDDSDAPRFIENVPRQGYRFIAHVQELTSLDREPLMLVNTPPACGGDAAGATGRPRSSLPRWALAGLASVLGLSLSIWLAFRQEPAPAVLRVNRLTLSENAKLGPIVSDGPRLYFTELDGGYRIVQSPATGGQVSPLGIGIPNPYLCDIAPDGTHLLVRSVTGFRHEDGPLWIVPLIKGLPRRLSDGVGYDGSWSPEGKEIAFTAGKELWMVGADGRNARRLARLEGGPWWPRWSPDGRRIRFTVSDLSNNTHSLWEIGRDGRNLKPLLEGWNVPPGECCGSWTPDGKFFVFQSSQGGRDRIWVLRESAWRLSGGRNLIQLTKEAMPLLYPSISRDGGKIFAIGILIKSEIVRYDFGSGRFLPALADVPAETLAYSPDGKRIAYTAVQGRTLWRAGANGEDRLRLTPPGLRAALPAWSPDGKQIAFMAQAKGRGWKLALVSADSGPAEELLPGDGSEADPSWSPDGKRIAFGRIPALERSPSNIAIYVLDLATRAVTMLPGSSGLFSPRWSPDGRHIVAMSADAGKLVLFDFATKRWTELANVRAGFPCWSQDGRHVYFLDRSGKDPSVGRVRLRDRRPEKVASLKGIRQPATAFGGWIGLDPDGAPLAIRDLSSQDVYGIEWRAR